MWLSADEDQNQISGSHSETTPLRAHVLCVCVCVCVCVRARATWILRLACGALGTSIFRQDKAFASRVSDVGGHLVIRHLGSEGQGLGQLGLESDLGRRGRASLAPSGFFYFVWRQSCVVMVIQIDNSLP